MADGSSQQNRICIQLIHFDAKGQITSFINWEADSFLKYGVMVFSTLAVGGSCIQGKTCKKQRLSSKYVCGIIVYEPCINTAIVEFGIDKIRSSLRLPNFVKMA